MAVVDNLYFYPLATGSTTTNTVIYTSNSTLPVTSLPAPKPWPVEGSAKPEDPISWLRRRVEEVCWTPA